MLSRRITIFLFLCAVGWVLGTPGFGTGAHHQHHRRLRSQKRVLHKHLVTAAAESNEQHKQQASRKDLLGAVQRRRHMAVQAHHEGESAYEMANDRCYSAALSMGSCDALTVCTSGNQTHCPDSTCHLQGSMCVPKDWKSVLDGICQVGGCAEMLAAHASCNETVTPEALCAMEHDDDDNEESRYCFPTQYSMSDFVENGPDHLGELCHPCAKRAASLGDPTERLVALSYLDYVCTSVGMDDDLCFEEDDSREVMDALKNEEDDSGSWWRSNVEEICGEQRCTRALVNKALTFPGEESVDHDMLLKYMCQQASGQYCLESFLTETAAGLDRPCDQLQTMVDGLGCCLGAAVDYLNEIGQGAGATELQTALGNCSLTVDYTACVAQSGPTMTMRVRMQAMWTWVEHNQTAVRLALTRDLSNAAGIPEYYVTDVALSSFEWSAGSEVEMWTEASVTLQGMAVPGDR
eukprot:NODE_348_length_2403_cov_10.201784_g323_i0.p1 GENE.NODE_348_length_2403_cov_10.201784_g323_i0~~NODE_348_length_2403_cov_10.201784_g323_i0.p1  ORF type:complete len:464 (-),score=91.83 NODE_348_length_2403_cov_10.201784_g323_i0:965-2356(-)